MREKSDFGANTFSPIARSFAHAAYKRGDLVLLFSYINGKRCAFFIPARDTGSIREYYPITEGAVQYLQVPGCLAEMARYVALGLDLPRSYEARIADLMRDHLDELLEMDVIAPKELYVNGEIHSCTLRCVVEDGEEFANDARV